VRVNYTHIPRYLRTWSVPIPRSIAGVPFDSVGRFRVTLLETSDFSPWPQPSPHFHTCHIFHHFFTVDIILFNLYSHHVLFCALYIAHAFTVSYHNPSTQPGVFTCPPLACTPSCICMYIMKNHVSSRGGMVFACSVLFWILLSSFVLLTFFLTGFCFRTRVVFRISGTDLMLFFLHLFWVCSCRFDGKYICGQLARQHIIAVIHIFVINYLIYVVLVQSYSSQSHRQGSRLLGVPSVNPQPWRFTNNSLGLPHAHSFFVCLSIWVCVVCVWFLLYLYVYMSFARCVFRVLFHIHDHLFQFQNVRLHPYCCTHNIVLIIQLYLFSVLFQVIFIKIVSTLICTHVTVSIDVYKHRLAYMTLLNIIKMNNEI